MDEMQSLSRAAWERKFHVGFIPKCRSKTLRREFRQHLPEVLSKLAEQNESRIEESHRASDHVRMMISIPPKYSVPQVNEIVEGKSAIHMARAYGERKRNFADENFWAQWYFVSTVGGNEAVKWEYSQKHEKEEQRLERLGLWR